MIGLLTKFPDILRTLIVGGVLGNQISGGVVDTITGVSDVTMLATYLAVVVIQLVTVLVKKRAE